MSTNFTEHVHMSKSLREVIFSIISINFTDMRTRQSPSGGFYSQQCSHVRITPMSIIFKHFNKLHRSSAHRAHSNIRAHSKYLKYIDKLQRDTLTHQQPHMSESLRCLTFKNFHEHHSACSNVSLLLIFSYQTYR